LQEPTGSTTLKFQYQCEPNVILLHDHQPNQEPPQCDAFTVAPVSPDKKNSHEYKKHSCLVLWIPRPTPHEIEAMNSVELKLEAEKLKERVDLFGPITRFCLSTDDQFSEYSKELQRRMGQFKFTDLHSLTSAVEIPHYKRDGLSWWIVHVDTKDTLRDPYVVWASAKIFDKVTEKIGDQQLLGLEDYIEKNLRQPIATVAPPTKEYEVWVNNKIAKGAILQLSQFNENKKPTTPSTETFQFANNSEIYRQYCPNFDVGELNTNKGKLFTSSNSTAKLCDSAVVVDDTLYLFQSTVGTEHGITNKGVTHYFNQAQEHELKNLKLIYIVPQLSYFVRLNSAEYTQIINLYIQNKNNKKLTFDFGIYLTELRPKQLIQAQ